MTAKGRKRQREPWREALLDELTDESEDERLDFASRERNLFESEHGPEMGDDGDDSPEYAQAKGKLHTRDVGKEGITRPEQLVYAVQMKQNRADNLPGQMVEAGHGFSVNDPRSRPWKTARRTHCAHCGLPLPAPDVGKYRCEFDPDASIAELALIGSDQGPEDRLSAEMWPGRYEREHHACQCSGCNLRWLVGNGRERNRGNPRKYCSADCTRSADNERSRWKRAVVSAEKRGDEPPPEPEDKGLKHRPVRALRSSGEGGCVRYTSATGHRWSLPRA